MRSSKSRSRSKSNRQRSIGNIINRVFDSSGPEGKVRGTPQQIIDKYLMLARDAQLSNDRVAEQNFLQHAEHYTRMLGEAQREMAREQESRQQQGGQPQQGYPQQGQYAQGQGGQYPAQGSNGNGHGQPNGNGHGHGYQPREREVRPVEDLQTELPPVIAVAEEDVSSLVETPENQPARPRREPRRPRSDAPKPRPEPAAEPAPAPEEAAEPAAPKAEKPARPRSRSPRKPRAEGKDAAPEASSE